MGILDPFFQAVQTDATQSRYFLGFRMKSPGADLVMFRHDGLDENGLPKGNGLLFHYAGYNGPASDPPQLMAVNNIRNTFLFEVAKPEYQAVESQIDMMRLNGHANPYYFSRSLGLLDSYERKGQLPLAFDGSHKPVFDEETPDYFMRPSDSTPMVAVNCVHLALQTLEHIGRINLAEIDPELPMALRGQDLLPVFERLKERIKVGDLPQTLTRTCLVFSETGDLVGRHMPHPVKAGAEPAPAF